MIQPAFEQAHTFREFRALIQQNGRFAFIDESGTSVITPAYVHAKHFSEGLSSAEREEWRTGSLALCGFINTEGRTVIPPQFMGTQSFRNELCFVRTEDSVGYINHNGDFVWKGPYVECRIE